MAASTRPPIKANTAATAINAIVAIAKAIDATNDLRPTPNAFSILPKCFYPPFAAFFRPTDKANVV